AQADARRPFVAARLDRASVGPVGVERMFAVEPDQNGDGVERLVGQVASGVGVRAQQSRGLADYIWRLFLSPQHAALHPDARTRPSLLAENGTLRAACSTGRRLDTAPRGALRGATLEKKGGVVEAGRLALLRRAMSEGPAGDVEVARERSG